MIPLLLALIAGPRLDVQGDPIPTGAVARIGSVRYRVGESRVWTLSPDGKTFAVAGEQNITLWDVETGRPATRIPLPDPTTPRALVYAPDGKALVYRGGKVLHILEPAARRVRWSREVGTFGPFVGFLPGGAEFFLAERKSDRIAVYDLANGGPPEIRTMGESVDHLSPDGRWLVHVEAEEVLQGPDIIHVTLLDPATGRGRGRVADSRLSLLSEEHPRPDRHGWAVSVDSRRLYSMGVTGRLMTFDLDTGRVLEDLDPPPAWITPEHDRPCLALSPDGNVIYASVDEMPVRRRDLAAKRWLDPLPVMPYGRLVPHPDGRRVLHLGSEGLLRQYRLATGREVSAPPGFAGRPEVVPSPDGRRVAGFVSYSGEALGVFEIDGRPIWSANVGSLRQVVWSPDGRHLAGIGEAAIAVLDAGTGREVRRLVIPARAPRGLCAGFGNEENYKLLLHRVGEEIALAGVGRPVADRAGALFALTQERVNVEWKEDPDELRRWVSDPCDSPDGAFLLTWDLDGVAVLRDPRTGTRLGRFATRCSPSHSSFSPNGLWLAVADEATVTVFDVPTGRPLKRWDTPDRISSIAFAGSGKLVTGQDDRTALVWDIKPTQRPTVPPWDAICGPDAVEAYRAIGAVATDPAGPELVRAKLPPAFGPAAAHRWVAELNADRYAVRERAGRELAALGRPAAGALRTALARTPSAEVRMRLEGLLARTPSYRQHMEIAHARAVLAMELAGTPAAVEVLTAWASGDPGETLTIDARAALGRLRR